MLKYLDHEISKGLFGLQVKLPPVLFIGAETFFTRGAENISFVLLRKHQVFALTRNFNAIFRHDSTEILPKNLRNLLIIVRLEL